MKRVAIKISLLYLFMGTVWILGSDRLMLYISSSLNIEELTLFQSIKGFAYVFLTSALLYALVINSYRRLQNSENKYKKLFNESPVPKVVYEEGSFKVLDANKAAHQKFGYSKKEVNQLCLESLFAELDLNFEEWESSLSNKNGSPTLVKAIKKDGTQFWVHTHSSPGHENGGSTKLLVVLDVHDKIIAEQKRKEAEKENRKLSLVAQETQNSVLILDKEGKIEWVNAGFVRHTGYQLEEVMGKNPGSMLHGPDTDKTTIRLIREKLRKKDKFMAELISYRKDTSSYWVRIFISPIFNEEGDLVQFISIGTDITERQEFIGKLERQNSQLKEIAWISSHEIRRPVASILGLISLYNDKEPDAPLNREIIGHLETTAKELDGVIHQIVSKTYEVEELDIPYTYKNE